MEFNFTTTVAAFVAINALGIAAMLGSGMMAQDTVLMMVAPSMLIFGAIMLALGVKFGEYRARTA